MEIPKLRELVQDSVKICGAWVLGTALASSGIITPVSADVLQPRTVSALEAYIPEEVNYLPDEKPQKIK